MNEPMLPCQMDGHQLASGGMATARGETKSGSITTAPIKHGKEEGWVRVSVCDTGIGIPSEELKRIFERFYRVDKARGRSTGGTGLGLPIVKEVVERMGGTVAVESQLGHGSRFTIRLQAA